MVTDDLSRVEQLLRLAGEVAEVPGVGVDRVLRVEGRRLAVVVVVPAEPVEHVRRQLGEAMPALRPLLLRVEVGREVDLRRDDDGGEQVTLAGGGLDGLDEVLVRHGRLVEGTPTVAPGQLDEHAATGPRAAGVRGVRRVRRHLRAAGDGEDDDQDEHRQRRHDRERQRPDRPDEQTGSDSTG